MNVVTSPRLLLLALTLLCMLATAPGCKTDEQKYLESFLAMDEDVLQVLADSAPDADKAVKLCDLIKRLAPTEQTAGN